MTDPAPTSLSVSREDHVLVLTIERPQARNAADADLATRMADALDEADRDREVRCVVITGSGDKAFCAGADLKGIGRGEFPLPAGREHYGFAGVTQHPTSTPLIAAVNGMALGGGAEIVLACDLAVAAESATFGLPEVKRGLIAAAGGVFRLPEQVPPKVAMRMMLTGEPIDAAEALRWGFVNEVVPDGQALDAALRLAAAVAANAPLAVQASKRLAWGKVDGQISREQQSWERNQAEMTAIVGSSDVQEGVLAFIEKRPPAWTAS